MSNTILDAENPIPSQLSAQQRAFLAFVRNPTGALPAGANPRAMQIYADLVYRNLAGLIDQFYPVCSQVCQKTCAEGAWQALLRAFIASHPSQTPYFLAIAEEFLQFLITKPAALKDLPVYLTELAHYEWVELALDVADIPQPAVTPSHLNHWDGRWQLAPLAWVLAYQYPVHEIGVHNPQPAPAPSAYVVYRNASLEVKFIGLTLATAQWLQAISPTVTPRTALQSVREGEEVELLIAQITPVLRDWIELGVLIPA